MKSRLPSWRTIMLSLLALLLLGAIAFVMLRTGPLAPVQVTVVQATQGRLTPALYGIGTVEARRTYLIGPTSAGRVLRVLVDVGDTVKPGQLLAEMDPIDLDQRLAALDAALERAGSAIEAADAYTADAAARRELAAISSRRYLELGRQGFMSAGAVDAKLQEQASAEAGARAAQANLSAARQDRTRVSAERAALVTQRHNARLVATRDGVVLSRDAEPGSTVVAGQSVLKLVEPASLWVKARFDQGRSAGLSPGLEADIVLRSSTATSLRGKVVRVELQGDSVTEERVAQIAFDTLPLHITVGELAEVTLKLPATAEALVLPRATIKHHAGQPGVWLLEQGRARFATLRLGQSSLDGQVQILEGVRGTDQVVLYSEKDIDTRSRIKVVHTLERDTP